jgi:hypothetical protein
MSGQGWGVHIVGIDHEREQAFMQKNRVKRLAARVQKSRARGSKKLLVEHELIEALLERAA